MNDDWTVIDTVTDDSGKQVEIAHAEGKVRIAVRSPAGIVLTSIVLDADGREAFDLHYETASWQADVYAEQAAQAASL